MTTQDSQELSPVVLCRHFPPLPPQPSLQTANMASHILGGFKAGLLWSQLSNQKRVHILSHKALVDVECHKRILKIQGEDSEDSCPLGSQGPLIKDHPPDPGQQVCINADTKASSLWLLYFQLSVSPRLPSIWVPTERTLHQRLERFPWMPHRKT